MKSGRLTILGAVLALAALFSGAATAENRNGVELFDDDMTLGSRNAPVTLVEYLSPSCPHCAHFNAEIVPQLRRDYVATGKVLFVVRIFPMVPADGAVSALAQCLGPGRYVEFLDLAFRNQAIWDPNGHDVPDMRAALVRLGGMAGLPAERANRCMLDQNEFDRVNRIAEDGQRRYHIGSVPTLILNGVPLVSESEITWPDLRTRIEQALPRPPRH